MPSLSLRNGRCHTYFRYRNEQYERSLQTSSHGHAQAAINCVTATLHCLRMGQLSVPDNVDVGDFVVRQRVQIRRRTRRVG
jgi:hypothetical protein